MSKTYEILLTHDFCGSNVFVLSLDCYTFYLKVLIWCKIMLSLLGETLDYKLTFSSHINNPASKAGAQLCALNRIKRYLDKDAKLTFAKTSILSHFHYCPIIWHFCGKVNANKLENIILEVF